MFYLLTKGGKGEGKRKEVVPSSFRTWLVAPLHLQSNDSQKFTVLEVRMRANLE